MRVTQSLASLVLLGVPLVTAADVQLQGLTVPAQFASNVDAFVVSCVLVSSS